MHIPKRDDLSERSNLTKSQLLIWLGQKLNPEIPLYNMVLTFTIAGKIRPIAFQEAFQTLVNQSDALRTIIAEVDGVPQQRVLQHFPYKMEFLDFSQGLHPETKFQKWLDARCVFQFNLEERLFDAVLIKIATNQFIWYLNQHHLITDGWSVSLVYRRMAELYELALKNQLTEAPILPAFQDYANYERTYRQSSQYDQAKAYWQQKVAKPLEPVRFYGNVHPENSLRTESVLCDLGPERTEKLKAIAMEKGVQSLTLDLSLFSIFATLLFTYLYRISGGQHLAIGAPSHNRPSAVFKETIGLFIEIFPLHIEIVEGETFLTLIRKVMGETYDFLRYAQPGTSDIEFNKFYNVVLNYMNASFPDFGGLPAQSKKVPSGYADSNHSLRLQVYDFDDSGSFLVLFDFNCDVFDVGQRHWAIEHFLRVVDGFIADRTQPISQVELLSDEEKERILVEFNQTDAAYPADRTIVQQFETQVTQTPQATALVFEGKALTYHELNSRANELAHYLKKRGVGPEVIVGMCVERSLDMIVGILGILKSGGAYVPLAPDYPQARLAFMLTDGQVPVLLTQKLLLERLPEYHGRVICLDADYNLISQENETNPVCDAKSENLAYAIYTSGSTGEPKAVLIERRNVLNLVIGLNERIYRQYGKKLNVAMVAPYVFDPSVQQIFGALLQGHTLHIVPEDTRVNGTRLLEFFQTHQIDISDGTPAHIRLLVEHIGKDISKLGVKHLIIGGEALPPKVVGRFFSKFDTSAPKITNIYGPAECCVDSISFEIPKDKVGKFENIPIGVPMPNEQIYIANEENQLQPIGVPGELCIGGAGVGRGYLRRDDITAEKFVDNPFEPGTKLYRTGDIGRYLPDGNIEFIGRKDNQVKIRGFRIELGEIENRLKQYRKQTHLKITPNENDGSKRHGRCMRCLLTTGYPDVQFDEDGVCSICREFDEYNSSAEKYFRPFEDFEKLVNPAKAKRQSEYDCLLLYSGGKDSSYVLYRLVDMGLKVLAFTFDNGFISAAAFRNIERQTSKLNVDCIISKTDHMDEIFVESLNSDRTVCSGCFKSLTTISTKLAQEKDVNVVITGLSRGQIIDTKLEGLFQQGIFDVEEIDRKLLLFRKMYHSNNDRTSRLLNVDLSDVSFDDIHFVDFFRYDSTPVHQIREYLKERDAYWRQPKDTGFCSSNCMMNDIGICVHSEEKGYHNYEAPLSWDIRLGIIQREEGLAEVEPESDVRRVNNVLDRIGYFVAQIHDAVVVDRTDENGNSYLCAYYVATQKLTASELRNYLADTLPDYMIPAHFVEIDEMPLTPNGKVDQKALPEPEGIRPELEAHYVAPGNQIEENLVRIWT